MPHNSLSRFFHYLWLLVIAKVERFAFGLKKTLGDRPSISPDEERWVVMRDGTHRTRVHIYRNEAARNLSLQGGKSPVLINWHGGGFILDRLGQEHTFFQHIFQHPSMTGQPLTIIDAYYSPAPEHPFPAAIHDALDVTSWVFANPFNEWNISKIVLSGFSAGGNLVLATSAAFGRDGANPIKGAIAFFPACDTSGTLPPYRTCLPPDPKTEFPGFVLTDSQTRRRFDTYFHAHPESSARKSLTASPSNADAKSFPAKVLLFTCEYDTLREMGEVLRKKLEGSVDVRGWTVPGVGHNWDHFVGRPGEKGFKEKVDAYDASAEFIAEILRRD